MLNDILFIGMNLTNHSSSRMLPIDKHSKKENDYQKLNKQTTMLYLHHHHNQNNIANQSSTSTALTHSLIANQNNDKYGMNSNSFCVSKGSYHGGENQHSSRASSSHMSYHQQPLKEMHPNDLENRPLSNLHHNHNLPHITQLNQN